MELGRDIDSGVATTMGIDVSASTSDNVSEGDEGDTTPVTRSNFTTTVAPSPPVTCNKNSKKVETRDVVAKAEKESLDEKGGNITGRLNNLVTSDLENITDGRDLLFTGKHSLTNTDRPSC